MHTIVSSDVWHTRKGVTYNTFNGNLNNATQQIVLSAVSGKFCWLYGWHIRPAAACIITLEQSTGADVMLVDLGANEDFVFMPGFMPIRPSSSGIGWAIRHNLGVPVQIDTVMWGIYAD